MAKRVSRPTSDHFDRGVFFNPGQPNGKSWLDVLRWQLGRDKAQWPEWVDDVQPVLPKPLAPGQVARLTFVNHASFLIQFQAGAILTDPIWSKRTSPFQWLGPARVRPPGIEFDNLPKIDFVLISHNHYDHMDEETLQRLQAAHDPVFLVGLGDGYYLRKYGIAKIQEMDWGQQYQPEGGGLTIHYEKAKHWSRRSFSDTNQSLWGSYVIEVAEKRKIYFAGDTGYHTHFTEILAKHGPMDVSLLPIGAYEPRWFMKASHMNPEEAVQAHRDLQSGKSLAMHFGTFQLTDEGITAPAEALTKLMETDAALKDSFLLLAHGQSFEF